MRVPTIRRLLILLGAVVLVSACRLDATVGVTIAADGTGDVNITATVDRDVVERVPGLAGSLALDDATSAGWVVEGPAATEDGGLSVTLRHQFATVEEAASLLNSLGPPFTNIAFERTATEEEVAVAMSGTLTLPGGTWDAFGDQALVAAAGGTPFGQQLAESQATPASAMSIELAVRLPGEIDDTTGDRQDGAVTWTAPLDGSAQELTTRSVLRAGSSDGWAGPVSTVALVVLIAWLVAGAVLIALVLRARARRRNRPLRRLY